LITCRELIETLDDYVEDRMGGRAREAFEAHLPLCPDCESYLASYRRTVEYGRAAFADLPAAPPAEVPEELILAILAARTSDR